MNIVSSLLQSLAINNTYSFLQILIEASLVHDEYSGTISFQLVWNNLFI